MKISPLLKFKGHLNEVNSLQVRDHVLFSASSDQVIRLWNPYTSTHFDTFEGHSGSINTIIDDETTSTLYSNSMNDKEIFAWRDRKLLYKLKGHTSRPTSMIIHNQTLFSGSQDKTIKAWLENDCIHTFTGHEDMVTQMLSNDSDLYSGSIDKTAIMWDLTKGVINRQFKGHTGWVFCISICDNLLFTGSQDSSIRIWDIRTSNEVKTLLGHKFAIFKLVLKDKYLYSASWDGTIGVWNLNNFKPYFLQGHSGKIRTLIDGGKYIYSGGNDGTIRAWRHNKCKFIMEGHSGPVICLRKYKGMLYSSSSDKTIMRWPSSLKSTESEKAKIELEIRMESGIGLRSETIKFNINGIEKITDSKKFLCEYLKTIVKTPCRVKKNKPSSICGKCSVLIDGELFPSCTVIPRNGMNVFTNHIKISLKNKQYIDIENCINERNLINCKSKLVSSLPLDKNEVISFDYSKCIDCGYCIQICQEEIGIGVWKFNSLTELKIKPKLPLNQSKCVRCGYCTKCPTKAISFINNLDKIKSLLNNMEVKTIVGIHPSFPNNKNLKLIGALRTLGFNKIIDLSFCLDIYSVEESKEFNNRTTENNLPLISSWCPVIVNIIKNKYPNLIGNLCKSLNPIEIFLKILKKNFPNFIPIILSSCPTFKQFSLSLTPNEFKELVPDISIFPQSNFDDIFPISKSNISISKKIFNLISKFSKINLEDSTITHNLTNFNFIKTFNKNFFKKLNNFQFDYFHSSFCNICEIDEEEKVKEDVEENDIDINTSYSLEIYNLFQDFDFTINHTPNIFPKIPKNLNIYDSFSPIKIIFATTTGMSESIALRISTHNYNQNTQILDFSKLNINNIFKWEFAVFIISSNIGGSFPPNCYKVFQKIKKKKLNLQNLKYAIYGLGNSNYINFCSASIKLDILLESLGAIRLFELIKGDYNHGYLKTVDSFIEKLKIQFK